MPQLTTLAQQLNARGVASRYISHLTRPHRVILYCRVSSQPQRHNGNLQDDINKALTDLRRLHCTVLKVVSGVETSQIFAPRGLLQQAIDLARKQHDTILVSPWRDRIIRHRGEDYEAQPTVAEYNELIRLAAGVTIATIEHPDSTETRSKQTKRGLEAKGRRPHKPRPGEFKCRRLAWLPLVAVMATQGMSMRAIAAQLNKRNDGFRPVTPKTIWLWVQGV